MTPAFTDPAARLCWDAYFAKVGHLLSRAGADAAELRGELEAHVADSMAAGSGDSELGRLGLALSRLGEPAHYLRPLIADQLIERGTRSYSPSTIARGLSHSVLSGSRRTAIALGFGLGYLLLAIFAGMAILKPLWGEHVGLFRNADGTVSAGIVARAAGSQELLGWWSIPIALLLTGLLYIALTKGLRVLRHRR